MELMSLNFQYFFDAYPPFIKDKTFWILFFISFLAIATAFLIKYLIFWKPIKIFKNFDKYTKELFKKFYEIAATFGFINLVFLFFRKTQVPYFQMRFLMIVFWVMIFVWFSTAMQHFLIKVPTKRAEDAKRRQYEKYIK